MMFGLDSFDSMVWAGIAVDVVLMLVALVSIVIAYRSLTK